MAKVTTTLAEQIMEHGRPTFDCEKHGRIKLDRMSVSRWSETQWYVFCPECMGWLGFTVEPVKN